MRRLLLSIAIAGVLVAGAAAVRAADVFSRSHLGETLSEISTDGGRWLNALEGVKLAELRGKPVLLIFTVLW